MSSMYAIAFSPEKDSVTGGAEAGLPGAANDPNHVSSKHWEHHDPAAYDPFTRWTPPVSLQDDPASVTYAHYTANTAVSASSSNAPWHAFEETCSSSTICSPKYLGVGPAGEPGFDQSCWSMSNCSQSPVHPTQDPSISHSVLGSRQPTFDPSLTVELAHPDDATLPFHIKDAIQSCQPEAHNLRRDSVRKNNARIEIPPERSLSTIERLIKQARDEAELKELKSQRRLLRNREAALASRQRKKRHTESLEVKEKDYVSQITALENQLADLRAQCSEADAKAQYYAQQHLEACNVIKNVQADKEEMVFKHTRETSLLRQRVHVLSKHAEASSALSTSAYPTISGMADFAQSMDALDVSSRGWDDIFFPPTSDTSSNYTAEGNMSTAVTTPASHSYNSKTQLQRQRQTHTQSDAATDQPIASGILFMLLLCGAFVASKSTCTPVVPRMPAEVRAASTTVLENLLRDAPSNAATLFDQSGPYGAQGSRPSSSPLYDAQHEAPSDDSLANLQSRMTGITKEQEVAQLFALTPDEYNSMTTSDGYPADCRQDIKSACHPRRNLAETLASLNAVESNHGQGDSAQVYTRSLLWSRIPEDVVKQFKSLVQQSQQDDSASTSVHSR